LSQQLARGLDHVILAHQRFADQEGFGAGLGHALDVGVAVDAAFGDEQALAGDHRGQLFGDREVDLQCLEIAIADADQVGRDDLLAVKYDGVYDRASFAGQVQTRIAAMDLDGDLADAASLVASWDRGTDLDNRAAPLSVMTALMLFDQADSADQLTDAQIMDALDQAADLLRTRHGRIDPLWSAVNRLHRGDRSVALAGGPDTLRAVNSVIDQEAGTLTMLSGDGLHMLAEWAPGADYPDVFAVHQFGASNDPDSPHYADQMEAFAAQQLRRVPMREADVRAQASQIYRPGEAP